MTICPYGKCRMVNLCKGDHCVRAALERDGYMPADDGHLERMNDLAAALSERVPQEGKDD